MQTSDQDPSGTAAAIHAPSNPATPAGCPPSDIPEFCRSYFYTGKLLTEGDLNREQRYTIDKLRLHYVALHGWGVACGLKVQPHPQCPDRFVVTAGLAIDDCGREVRLVKDCVTLFPKPPEPAPNPCRPRPRTPEDCDPDPDSAGRRDPGSRYSDQHRSERDPDRRDPDPRRPEDCEDDEDESPRLEPPCQTYYVCIRYNECREDFMPVAFADCCGTSKQPNRICECATVELLTEPPECLRHMEQRKREVCELDCRELSEHIPEHCPPTGRVCCIPLAIIRDYVDCRPLTESSIDNSVRPVMPSVPRLEELVRCVMEHLPKRPPRLTHISRFYWEHDRVYPHEEFFLQFVGTHESPRGFEIEFDARVHAKGLNNRTFQAMIVHEPREAHEPRRIEVAPAHVIRGEDGRRCSLRIDHEYARHLREHNFDLFLTLRCDKVVDERGLAVDGNLLAGQRADEDHDYLLRHPTGDGVPGGLFESWIRVRSENKRPLEGERHEQ